MGQVNYDDIAEDYKKMEKSHPMKDGVINYWMLKLCGNLSGKRVLDLGCGSGFSSRALAKAGAKEVIGIDISEKEISIAKEEEKKAPVGITYYVGDMKNFDYSELGEFDIINSSVSLHYAENSKELEKFISLPSPNLKSGGKFVASIIHPDNDIGDWPTEKKTLDEDQSGDGKRVRVALCDLNGKRIVEFINIAYSREVYEKIFLKSGYSKVKWHDMVPPKETMKEFPEMYWKPNVEKPPLIIFEAIKN